MREQAVILRSGALVLLLGVCILIFALLYLRNDVEEALFEVTFLNIGQGDAVLIETPDGIDVLVDGGPDGGVLRELSRELGAFDRTIDMVVATHPDKDHIGGLVDVLERYDVKTVLLTENESNTAVSDAFRDGAGAEGASLVMARAGQTFTLGASTTLRVLFPYDDPRALESNDSSIVVQVSYGAFDVLLTGDAPSSVESTLVARYGNALRSEVLKLGHHGSRTSTAANFVAAVSPAYGIISAGKDNQYGHPHEEVLRVLENAGVRVANTAELGSIHFSTDGERFVLE